MPGRLAQGAGFPIREADSARDHPPPARYRFSNFTPTVPIA